jgi:hypothetical protein
LDFPFSLAGGRPCGFLPPAFSLAPPLFTSRGCTYTRPNRCLYIGPKTSHKLYFSPSRGKPLFTLPEAFLPLFFVLLHFFYLSKFNVPLTSFFNIFPFAFFPFHIPPPPIGRYTPPRIFHFRTLELPSELALNSAEFFRGIACNAAKFYIRNFEFLCLVVGKMKKVANLGLYLLVLPLIFPLSIILPSIAPD